MSVRRIAKRAAVYFVLAVVVFLLCSALAIHLEQRSIQERATVLFDGLRDLELRKASRAQAIAVIQRAGVPFSERGACPEANCNVEVELADFAWAHFSFFGSHPWLLRTYELLHGRPVRIRSNISIVAGTAWGKSFTLNIHVPPERNSGFFGYGYDLIADFGSQSTFYVHSSPELLLHPDYVIGQPGGCEICIKGWVYFTPYANSADVKRLMQVNLSCISRWYPCRDQADIMPVAWAEHVAERERMEDLYAQVQKCSPAYVALVGRDAWNVVVVEVIEDRPEHQRHDFYQVVKVRLVERLKRAKKWNLGTVHQARIFDEELPISITSKTIRPGMRLILAYDNYGQSESFVSPAQCGVIPVTKDTLAVVQAAVMQDFRARFENPDRVPF